MMFNSVAEPVTTIRQGKSVANGSTEVVLFLAICCCVSDVLHVTGAVTKGGSHILLNYELK